MNKKHTKARRPQTRKPRHVYPCANHPNVPAVAKCEVCGRPICKKCASLSDGANICSDACWNSLAGSDYKKATAEEKAARKRKNQRADRAVTLGMWAAALAVAGAVAVFILIRMADQTGEKLWETSELGYSHNCTADPDSITILFANSRGEIKALNARTGKSLWTVSLPKGERPSYPRIIDNDTCLVQSNNKLFLCGSSRSVPVWEFEAPQPAICSEPVVRGQTIFVASSTGSSYYDFDHEDYSSYDLLDFNESMYEHLVASATMRPQSMPFPEEQHKFRPAETNETDTDATETETAETDQTTTSTITAAALDSGKALWNSELEDVRITGLIADEERVYATGYRPMTYEEYSESLRKAYANEGSEEGEQDIGTTQIWALDAETGKPEWNLEGAGGFLVAPIMSEKGIIFATRRNIYLISPEGQIEWTYPLADKYILSVKVTEDALLFSTMDGVLMCLDLTSGEKKWMVTTGAPARKIIATYGLICVPGGATVQTEQRKVIPTKRWKGSEDLLEAALKKPQKVLQPNLMGLDPETGKALWTIDKVRGRFEYADGVIYVLSGHTHYLFMDASADSSEISKEVTSLIAYDAATGKKIWQQGIDGVVTDLKLAFGTALLESHSDLTSLAANQNVPGPVRLIAISLH